MSIRLRIPAALSPCPPHLVPLSPYPRHPHPQKLQKSKSREVVNSPNPENSGNSAKSGKSALFAGKPARNLLALNPIHRRLGPPPADARGGETGSGHPCGGCSPVFLGRFPTRNTERSPDRKKSRRFLATIHGLWPL